MVLRWTQEQFDLLSLPLRLPDLERHLSGTVHTVRGYTSQLCYI